MNRGLLHLLLCLLLAFMGTPAWAHCRPETRVGGSPVFSSVFASQETANPIGTPSENGGCGYDFASGVHKYLYGADNPVNEIDPSGNAAYYMERRFSGAKGILWPLELGHGYLLFTDASDPGTHNPIMSHQHVIDTFSWHPNVWDFKGKAPGRIWENHPFDINPGAFQGCVLLTTDFGQEKNLIQCVNNWKAATGCGYELGKPIKDNVTPDDNNQIGFDAHKPAPPDGVYYSLRGQNCVWWATIMVMQSGIQLQNPTAFNNAVSYFNTGGGGGYAGQVISGARSAFEADRMNGMPFGLNLAIPGYDLSGFDTGL